MEVAASIIDSVDGVKCANNLRSKYTDCHLREDTRYDDTIHICWCKGNPELINELLYNPLVFNIQVDK